MRLIAALLPLLLALPASAQVLVTNGVRGYDEIDTSRGIDFDGSTDYLCGGSTNQTIASNTLRAGRIFQAQEALWQHHGTHGLPRAGVWALRPPGSKVLTHAYMIGDVIRLWAWEHPNGRVHLDERLDLFWQWQGGTPGDDRLTPISVGSCRTGELSNDTSRGDGFCLDRVPICVGGSRDGLHAPLDPANGYPASGNPLCPGGTVTPTPFDWSWLHYIPRAKFLDDLPATLTTPSGTVANDLGSICDGVVPDPSAGDGPCGTGYGSNFGGSAATAAANLPARSMGLYLANNYGPNWPPSVGAAYYLGGYTYHATTDSGQVNSFMVDKRIEAAREWIVARTLDKLYWSAQLVDWKGDADRQLLPWAMLATYQKPGWEAYYDPDDYGDTPTCTSAATTKRWRGPGNNVDHADATAASSCEANSVGPMSVTPEEPYDYWQYECQVTLALLAQTHPTTGGYSRNVRFVGNEAPGYRASQPMAMVCQAVRNDPRYLGYRKAIRNDDDVPPGFDACAVPSRAVPNGPYAAGEDGCVWLRGRIEGARTLTAEWTAAGFTPEFQNPVTGSTGTGYGSTSTDPMARLCGVPTDGTPYKITLATSDGASQQTTVTAPLVEAAFPLAIDCNHTTGTVPFGVNCSVATAGTDTDEDTVENEWEDIEQLTVSWDFDDPGTPANRAYGVRAYNGETVPLDNAFGITAGYVYEIAGTPTITATATRADGGQAIATQAITANAFSGTTVCVRSAGTGDFTGCPGGASTATQANASTALSSDCAVGTGAKRCLFRRGDTFAAGDEVSASTSKTIMGAFGSGARPIVEGATAGFTGPDGSDTWVLDIDFVNRGLLGNGNERGFIRTTVRDGGAAAVGLLAEGDGKEGLYLVNFEIDNFGKSGGGGGLYGWGRHAVVTDSVFKDSGIDGVSHNFRLGITHRTALFENQFGPESGGQRAKLTGEGDTCETALDVSVAGNVCIHDGSGAQNCLGITPQGAAGDTGAHYVDRAVVERNLFTGTAGAAGSRIAFEVNWVPRVLVRNNLVDLGGYGNGIWLGKQDTAPTGSAGCPSAFPTVGGKVQNNTTVWTSATAPADPEWAMALGRGTFEARNNLLYTAHTGSWGSGSTFLSCIDSATCSPEANNERVTSNPFAGTDPFSTPAEFALSASRDGSAAEEVPTDFFGVLRAATPDQGAAEYAP